MDDQLQELENELKALRPRRPSVLLRARVERDLAAPAAAAAPASEPAPVRRYTSATTLRSWKWAGWQMAAVAAVLAVCAVTVGVWRHRVAPAPDAESPALAQAVPARPAPRDLAPAGDRMLAASTADVYRPVKAANLLLDVQDEGPVLLPDNTAGRRVRARYVDTYTWKNPATNASLKWSVPREEVRVLPANYH